MDDKDWRVLKTIAEEKSITKAAARLHISQPALTYRVKSIEEEFGIQAMLRLPSGIVITPEGELLVGYATEMLARLESLKDQLKNMENRVHGALRMGASGVFAHYVLPGLLKGFLNDYPEVDVSLKTGLSSQVLRMLEKQEIMLGIVRGEYSWDGERILLSEEPVCLVSREPIELDQLLVRPHIRYETDSSLQKTLDAWWWKTFAAPPSTTMEVTTMDTARQMVLHGLGWAILPMIGLGGDRTLHTRPLLWPDGKPLVRQTWVLCSDRAMTLHTVCAFLDYLKRWKALGAQGIARGGS